MIEVFKYSANAVLPIVLLIALGYFLRRLNFYDDNFLKTANKLGFKIILPTLLFFNVYQIESISSIKWSSVVFAVLTILLLFLIGMIMVQLFCKNEKQMGVILQSSFRSNFAIIGIPLSQALGGNETLAIVSVLSAFSIALFNVLAVISLTVFVKDENNQKPNTKSIAIKICKNPLIIGIVLGLICLAIRSVEPLNSFGQPIFTIKNQLPFLHNAIDTVGKMASPLMLIVLGGQFSFDTIKGLKFQIALGTVLRIAVAPLVGIGMAVLLRERLAFGASDFAAYLALFGSPIAVSSAVMASEMKNDYKLAGQLVVWTSIGSVFTLFAFSVILKYLNIL